jgi:hypothetical protein
VLQDLVLNELPCFDAKPSLPIEWSDVMTMMKVMMAGNSCWKQTADEHHKFAKLWLTFWDFLQLGATRRWVVPRKFVLQQYEDNYRTFATNCIIKFPLSKLKFEELDLLCDALDHLCTAEL